MAREETLSPQPVLLGLLMSRPRHGYELYQQFETELGRVWQLGMSQLYAQLHLLEEAGLVAAHTEPQEGRPPRKVYHLTAQGREAFESWLQQPTPYVRHLRVEFLARLYFYRALSLPGVEQLVGAQKEVCQAQMLRFARLAASEEDDFRRLVLEFRQGQLQAVVQWLDRCLEMPSTPRQPASGLLDGHLQRS
jgi:PadR family transcriptional regulator, regulatory protein AphA